MLPIMTLIDPYASIHPSSTRRTTTMTEDTMTSTNPTKDQFDDHALEDRDSLSNEELRKRIIQIYGKPPVDCSQEDILRLCHGEDDYFYVGHRTSAPRLASVEELVDENRKEQAGWAEFGNTIIAELDDGHRGEESQGSEFFDSGAWEVLNPLRTEQFMTFCSFNPAFGRRCNASVEGRHSFVFEFDDMLLAVQLRMWSESDMPFTLKTYSAGKSVHVLVRLDRDLTIEEWDEITVRTIAAFPGVDPSLLTMYCGWCRTPMVCRVDWKRIKGEKEEGEEEKREEEKTEVRVETGREQIVLEVGKIVPVEEFTAWLDKKLQDVDPQKIRDLRKKRCKTRGRRPPQQKRSTRTRSPRDPSASTSTDVVTEAQASGDSASVSGNVATPVEALPDYNPQVLALLQSWWERNGSDTGRSYKMQGAILYALNRGYTPDDIFSALLNWDVYQRWQEDHPDRSIDGHFDDVVGFFGLKLHAESIVRDCLHEGTTDENSILKTLREEGAMDYFADDDQARSFIRRQRSRHWGHHPVARVPIRNVHPEEGPVSPELDGMRRRFENIDGGYPTRTPNGDTVFRVMEKVFEDGSSVLTDFPCGSMKTTASLLVAATRANPDSRWWLVYETVADVREKTRMFRELGCTVRAWHSFHPDFCSNHDVPRGKNAYRIAPKKYCRSCEDRLGCPAYHRQTADNRWDPGDCDIVVTTHVHWKQALLHDAIPDSVVHVVVDESPALSETFELHPGDIGTLREVLGRGNLQVFGGVQGFNREVVANLDTGDCAQIDFHISDELRKRVLGFLHAEENSPLEGRSEHEIDLVYSFLGFFRGKALRFGMQQYQRPPSKDTGDRGPLVMSFLRTEVDIACKQHTVVLDGSATVSEVKWRGFELVRCPELTGAFPNMLVEIEEAHPSQTVLGNEDFLDGYGQKILDFVDSQPPGEKLILFTNKDLGNKPKIRGNIESLVGRAKALNPDLIHMRYGDHVGSNEGVEATATVFSMALFAPYSHYVLRAAAADEKPILADRIWRNGEAFGVPRIGKFRFLDDSIHAAYIRSVSRDIVQGIYRGCIRHDSKARYRVLLQVQGLAIIKWIEKQFPEADFRYRSRSIAEAYEEGAAKARIADSLAEDRDVTRRQLLKDIEKMAREMPFVPPQDESEDEAA
jgi:hypothetical protein